MENDLNRKKFLGSAEELFMLIFVGSYLIVLFVSVFVCNSAKEPQNTNATEEADHSGEISVECPHCGESVKLILDVDKK